MHDILNKKATITALCSGEEVLPTQMQPVQLEDFESYLGKYVGQDSILSLLLDYDGTLSPIAPHPDLATIPPETKKILERLANMPDVFIAVISGRSVNNVKAMVDIEGITYAGNHGLEIIHPDGTKVWTYLNGICNKQPYFSVHPSHAYRAGGQGGGVTAAAAGGVLQGWSLGGKQRGASHLPLQERSFG